MKSLLFIQPHSDDVLFSASTLLFNSQYKRQVLTVENNVKRLKEDEQLYKFLDISWFALNIPPLNDQSYYGYFKRYKTITVEQVMLFLQQMFGIEVLDNIANRLTHIIQQQDDSITIVAPLGIGHPFHLFIHETVKHCNRKDTLYYREFPHSYKRRNKEQIAQLTSNGYTLYFSNPVTNIADIKWQLAKKFYRTQSGLLFFEQRYIEKNIPEEFYTYDYE